MLLYAKDIFKKKKYLSTEILISDSLGCLIATSDGSIVHSATNYPQDDLELLRMFFEKKWDFVFYITNTSCGTYFGIKGEDIYVLKKSSKELKTYSLEEFVNCCWHTLYVPISN